MLGMRFKLEKVQDVIVACCVLHNFLMMENESTPVQQDEIDRQMDIGEQLIAAQQEARGEIANNRFLIDNHFNAL